MSASGSVTMEVVPAPATSQGDTRHVLQRTHSSIKSKLSDSKAARFDLSASIMKSKSVKQLKSEDKQLEESTLLKRTVKKCPQALAALRESRLRGSTTSTGIEGIEPRRGDRTLSLRAKTGSTFFHDLASRIMSKIRKGVQVYHRQHGTGLVVSVSEEDGSVLVTFFSSNDNAPILFSADSAQTLTITRVHPWLGFFEDPRLDAAYTEQFQDRREKYVSRIIVGPVMTLLGLYQVYALYADTQWDYDKSYVTYTRDGSIEGKWQAHSGADDHLIINIYLLVVMVMVAVAAFVPGAFRRNRGNFWIHLTWHSLGYCLLLFDWLNSVAKPDDGVQYILKDTYWAMIMLINLGGLMASPMGLLSSRSATLTAVCICLSYCVGFVAVGGNIYDYHIGLMLLTTGAGAKCGLSLDFTLKTVFLKEQLRDANVKASSSILKKLQAVSAEDETTDERDALIREAQGQYRWMVPPEDVTKGNKLGEGAFGDVFQARFLETEVALKTGKDILIVDFAEAVEEFLLHVQVQHPNIVQVLGACVEPAQGAAMLQFASILELMFRGSLVTLVHSDLVIEDDIKVRMARDVALAIEHLHFADPAIVHCDLKTENVFVTEDFVCKVGDLGGSRYLDKPLTHESAAMSVLYAPPQRCLEALGRQNFALRREDDVYSFGVCMFEIFAQEPPFDWAFVALDDPITSPSDFMERLMGGMLPLVDPNGGSKPFRSKSLDGLWSEFGGECVEYDPDSRPSMREVARKLQQHVADSVTVETDLDTDS